MDKITLKLIKYFMFIISLVVAVCLIVSSIFLSKFYFEQQYNGLKVTANQIYDSIKTDMPVNYTDISAVLIQNDKIVYLTQSRMGMMPFIHSAGESSLETKGIFKNAMGSEFIYYKLETDLGDIVVFRSNKYSSDYLKVVYIVLFFIFVLALAFSVPLISFIGKQFTKPVLKLEKAALALSRGDFDADCRVETGDEIEELSKSLEQMAAELKKKYKLQRDFIANVSHDFKTPLSVIRSYSEAINDELVDKNDTVKYSGEIIKEVDRLNSLVMDLLQLSKLQDGGYSLNRDFFDLSEFVQECTNQFKPLITRKKIAVTASIESVEIFADRKYLQRVLYNFIDNAVKFSCENSKIEISANFLNEYLKLSVKDYGIGIEKHLLEDIWDKYYKNAQSGGMGLGLPICREILKMHGFEYGVTSSPENGTEFYFLIPKADVRSGNYNI